MDNNNKKLTRSRSDRMLAGVCGGLAAYFGLDPSLVRIGYALLTFFTVFAGIPVYPADNLQRSIVPRRSAPNKLISLRSRTFSVSSINSQA